VPVPARLVDRWHEQIYLALQPAITGFSSRVRFAWLDVLIAAALLCVLVLWLRPLTRSARGRRLRLLGRATWATLALASTFYLAFLVLWGLNYQRAPLESRLAHDESRIDARAIERLATVAVDELNALHARAHAEPWPGDFEWPRRAGPAFAEAQRLLGATRLAVPAPPKWTMLGPYFRLASVAGMTDPFFLEVMITPDALPFERPAILAHEWGHLAGYANEAEAEFVGWLTCVRGDVQVRYSAWVALFPRLPRDVRASAGRRLGPGPRADFAAISARLERASPTVTRAAWTGYDRFLKAHHVAEGVASYDAVIRLVTGTRFGENWTPERRR
jgi:hypothetical protein